MAEVTDFVRRHRWALTVGFGLLLLVAYHAVWLFRMRDGFAVDIDEAGYLMIAFNNLDALQANGIDGLWDAWSQQAPNAPLVPLLAVPFLEVREGILPAFGVEWLAFLVVGAATYGLARTLVEPHWAALATLTVVAMPGLMNYTREFSFAVPCAAAFTVALLALLRSRNLTSLPMALVWGAAVGLAALSRTMALGLIPGLVLAALLWALLAAPAERRRSLLNFGAGVLAGFAVAGTWYIRNFAGVVDYLTGYGYGNEALPYGNEYSWFSLDRWTQALHTISWQSLFVPLLFVATAISILGLLFAIRSFRHSDRRAWFEKKLRSPAMPLAVFVLTGYLALTSTTNTGTVFALPLLPAAIVLLIAVAARFPIPGLRNIAAFSLFVVAFVQLLSFAQIGGMMERIRVMDVPLLGVVPVTDPRAPVVGATSGVPGQLRLGDDDRGWLDAGSSISRQINDYTASQGRTPIVSLGNRDIVLNSNFLSLSARLADSPRFPMMQLSPAYMGDTARAYRDALSDPALGQPNVLITSNGEYRDLEPVATQSLVRKAARQSGFRPFGEVRQPNGELLTLWWLERGPAIPSAPTVPVPPVQPDGEKKQPG